MQIPKITAKQAEDFHNVWNLNGVAIFMDSPHFQFAADFAQVILKSFIEQAMQAQIRAAQEAAKPKIVVVED